MYVIQTLRPSEQSWVEQAAALLVEEFRNGAPAAWPNMESALAEMREALQPTRICHVALDTTGQVIGWIGGIPGYDGRVWELHPLVVAARWQGRGIGRALVDALERTVASHGGLTITLGTDDIIGQTSLHGRDLYPDLAQAMQTIQNLARHPYTFYLKCGFVISGLVPDANGFGKPDILMAKRVVQPII